MKYNLKNLQETNKALEYLTELSGRECLVEVKRILPQRSIQQNRYFYVLLAYWGSQTGHSLAETKTIFKREVNPDIFVYEKNGNKFLKSSADVDKAEMTRSIDRFRKWSDENGLPLPAADEEDFMRWAENQAEINQGYL